MGFLSFCLMCEAFIWRCVVFFLLPIAGLRNSSNLQLHPTMEPPSKKMRKLLEHDSDSDSEDDAGGVLLGKQSPDAGFKINEDFARRFEHNKKREEVARCMG